MTDTREERRDRLDRKVRALSGSELREFQQREQACYPDRGGPSR